jgi:hypothetical protein
VLVGAVIIMLSGVYVVQLERTRVASLRDASASEQPAAAPVEPNPS